MESPVKCINNCTTGEMKFESVQQVDSNLVTSFWRCTCCFTTHQVNYGNPWLATTYLDMPQLKPMSGDIRWDYFKCSRPGGETYTLVAKKGHIVSKEYLEHMGFTVIERTDDMTLPAYRLYELV
jgi:hypothetical protein